MSENVRTPEQFAAERGALATDKHYRSLRAEPRNWADRIDINDFDINDCDRCVVGQVVGSYYVNRYSDWIDHLVTPESILGWQSAAFYGFVATSYYENGGVVRLDRDLLNEAWKEEIRKRQTPR